jgi:outer membrane protein OmpA-like peptidoglycan-associated protein
MTCFNAKIFMLTGLVLAGSINMAYAEGDYRSVLRDTNGEIIHSSDGNCVRAQLQASQDICMPQRVVAQQVVKETVRQRQETRTAAALTQEERTVYFKFDRAILSPESEERLGTLARVLKSDQVVKEAKIVGYADRFGSVSYNERLSQNRAQAVRDYLIANGYTNARVTETRWVGKSEPSTNCPTTEKRLKQIECLHNDRRVEVEIGYYPDGQAPNAR